MAAETSSGWNFGPMGAEASLGLLVFEGEVASA
jgi:hypothetical protein